MTFRKSKLIHNRPGWPPLNFREKCGNTMLLLPKPVLCRRSLNSLWQRRPAEEENRFLLLWEITVVCVLNLLSRGIILERGLVSALKANGLFDVILAKLHVWNCCLFASEARISRIEFVVLVELWKIRTLHELYSFVSIALFSSENEKSESEERFKRPLQALPSNVGFFAPLNSTG